MKKLKDITVNLKGVDQETVDNLINFASAFANEYDVFVTDPGYDLVAEEGDKIMATTSDETPLYPTPAKDAPHVEAKASVDSGSAVVHFYGLSEHQATLLRRNRLQDFLYTLTEGGTPA